MPSGPDGLRKLVGAVGVVQGAAALAFYVHPPLVIDWWPWQLSPLITRTIFSFFGFIAVVWLAFLWEDRWSALRLHVETATLGLVLVGLGAFRATEDLTGSPAMVALVFGLLAATVVGAVALYLSMQRSVPVEAGAGSRSRAHHPSWSSSLGGVPRSVRSTDTGLRSTDGAPTSSRGRAYGQGTSCGIGASHPVGVRVKAPRCGIAV